MDKKERLRDRYQFKADYIPNYEEFRDKVYDKTIIPYQVEFQPPPKSIKKICWLECPYCYGLSANDSAGDRMLKERAIKIMQQIADGGVKKVIFAGYATDPLNSPFLPDLLEIAIDNQMIFGFNTKALKVSPRLLELLARTDIQPESYMSLSVDAGSNEIYNIFHGVKTNPKIYEKVLANTKKIAEARTTGGSLFDISAAYLINIHNCEISEVSRFIDDFKGAGCDLLRFTFPQPPRAIPQKLGVIPSVDEKLSYENSLIPIIEAASSEKCSVMLVDADSEHDIFNKPRTTPCFARFIYPTIGYDGWLYHCSQSSSPNFRLMALGDLNTEDFWSVFYNYDSKNFGRHLTDCTKKMEKTGCRCDRKMHVTNTSVIDSSVFGGLT